MNAEQCALTTIHFTWRVYAEPCNVTRYNRKS